MSLIPLHIHSSYSLLDSTLRIEDAVKFAKDNGMSALAITEHGVMHGFVEQAVACRKAGIKAIYGVEAYEVDDDEVKGDTKGAIQKRYHLILLAKNKQGLLNLFKIVSFACTDGFYKKPLISIDRIKANNWGDGIICTTACLASRFSKLIMNYDTQEGKRWIEKLQSTFDYVGIEIQSHATKDQWEYNHRALEFAQLYDIPFLVTSDAHYLKESDMDAHEIFVKISQDREAGESYKHCFMQTEADVYRIMADYDEDVVKQAIDETQNIADMIDDIDIGLDNKSQMPIINVPPEYSSHSEYLRHLVYSTFDRKFGHLSEEEQQRRRDRIEMEFPVIEALGYVDYFLMCHMLLKEARKRGIPLGPGRGSSAGSLMLDCLDVTQIDSVEHNLNFSRFANLGRLGSLADVDLDISKRRRKEVIDIACDLFGKENVAPICTFNTLSTKVAIRDIGKVLNDSEDSPYYGQLPYSVRNEVSNMIPTIKTLNDLGEEEEKDALLEDLMHDNAKLRGYYESFPLWFEYVMALEGLPRSRGRHAAGTLITPKPIIEYMPLCLDNEKNVIAQLEMGSSMNQLSCVKMDFLGLKTLDVIDDTLKSAGLTWEDVDVNKLDLNDKRVFDEVYASGFTKCVFQMESLEASNMCVQAHTDNTDTVIAINAFCRPGTKNSFPEYCQNKSHPEQAKVIHPDLKELLGSTNNVLLYQEELLDIFRYAGFAEDQTDVARRAVGHKQPEVMKKLEAQFKNGLKDKGWTEEQSNAMWDYILKQTSYIFNKSHACAYGLLSYLTAWLKVHYPVQYMSACMSCDSGNPTKLAIIINECKRLGIRVLPPNINKSNRDFTPLPDKNSILFGLLAIKGLGDSVIEDIIANRPYKSFDEFLSKGFPKTTVVQLIKSGAFTVSRKEELLESYCSKLIEHKEYTPVKTIPSKTELLLKWGIDTADYKTKGKLDKELLLHDFNLAKQIKFESQEEERYAKEIQAFKDKYMQDLWLSEFSTLGLFITSDPLEFAYDKIHDFEQVETDTDAVLIGVIIGIQRKKDKRNQLFCYVQIYTPGGIREAICWASTTKQYLDLLKNGNCVAIYGRKTEGGNIVVNEMKLYKKWLDDKHLKHVGVNA